MNASSVRRTLRASFAATRFLVALGFLAVAPHAAAGSVNLAWDAVISPAASGYKIHYGPSVGNYTTHIDVGNKTTYTVAGLTEGATYHLAVTAYASGYTESGYSNDVTATVAYSVPIAQFTGTPTSGTSPLTVNFSNASSGTITSYAWSFGDGGTSTAAAPSHVYAAAGTYTVSLAVTGPGGSNTQTRTNYVTATTPPAPVAQFTGNPTAGTSPLTVSFTNTSTGSITSYAWSFGDGGTSTLVSPSHVYMAAGTYTVSLTVTGPGGSNTQTRSSYVTVTPIRDVGLYRKFVFGTSTPLYKFMLDYDFDHVPDARIQYGAAGDVPLVGYMSPGGKSSLITYRTGWWYIDSSRDGVTDVTVPFGMAGDVPLTANFSGPGQLDDLVLYRGGIWYVDTDLSGTANLTFVFGGMPGDIPLAGDVNGDGIADLAIYRNGFWYIDTNRNGTADMTVIFGGMPQDVPVLFDWDGDGKADLCIFRDGIWYISTKRDGAADVIFVYGAAGDLPMPGKFH